MVYDHLWSFLHTLVAIPCYTSVNVIVIIWYILSPSYTAYISWLISSVFGQCGRPCFGGLIPDFRRDQYLCQTYPKEIRDFSIPKKLGSFFKKIQAVTPIFFDHFPTEHPSPPPSYGSMFGWDHPRRPRNAGPRWRRMAIYRNSLRPWRWRMTGRPSSASWAPGISGAWRGCGQWGRRFLPALMMNGS